MARGTNGPTVGRAMALRYSVNSSRNTRAGTLVELGGRNIFNSYGKCTMRDDVDGHVSRWQEVLNKNATDLLTNEEDLYYRIREVLPTEMENECARIRT